MPGTARAYSLPHLDAGFRGDRTPALGGAVEARGGAGWDQPRATLHRYTDHASLRTALELSFPTLLRLDFATRGLHGMWLLESLDGSVSVLGRERAGASRSIGGRVLHDLPVLDASGAWLDACALALARARLGATAGSGTADTSLCGLIAGVERDLLASALLDFQAELDGEVLAVIRGEGTPTPKVYNHYRSGVSVRQRNRLQAAKCYPGFSPLLRQDWTLRQAVDGGRPLTSALAARLGVGEHVIQKVRGLSPGAIPGESLSLTLRRAARVPADYVPDSPEDWAVFLSLQDGLEALAQTISADAATLLQPFSEGWRRGLERIESRLGGRFDVDAVFELMHGTYDYGVRPAIQAALEDRFPGRPLRVAPKAPPGFFQLWFGRYGVGRLAEMAVRWRDTYGQFSLTRLDADAGTAAKLHQRWPTLLDGAATHAGLRVVELDSRQALEIEGRRLAHCVASYAVKCLLSDSFIFSIRNPSGGSLSTFEVQLPQVGRPELLRHHGLANANPGETLDALARRFCNVVLARVPAERIAEVRRVRQQMGLPLRAVLGEPNTQEAPYSAAERDALAQLLDFAHPAEARRLGIPEFLRQSGRPVLERMVPVGTLAAA